MPDGQANGVKSLTFDVATAAIRGSRDYQEDSLLANFPVGQDAGFAIIADGIGGHAAGNVASALVTTEVFAHLKMQESLLIRGVLDVPFALRQAAEQANQRLAKHAKEHDETRGMGSTLLVPVVRTDRLYWLSIGDSPLYLFRNGDLRQLNKDHSMAPQIDMMVKSGAMTPETGRNHPDRNTLTSVVNGQGITEVDCPKSPILLKEGDILIAASDGLQSLPTRTIARILLEGSKASSIDIADAFLAEIAALDNPDQDNTTFIVLMAREEDKTDEVMDLDRMPVLAHADDMSIPPPKPSPVTAPQPAKAMPDESKAYYYRGQKYYRD